jgi:hypothetical protein
VCFAASWFVLRIPGIRTDDQMEQSNAMLAIVFALMFVLALVAKGAADWADRQNGVL